MERRAYTKSFATIYDDVMKNVPYDLWYKYVKELINYYNINVNKFIDLACGTGNMTFRFAEKEDWHGCGVDISENMLNVARKKAKDKNINVDFLQFDLRKISFKQKKFDLAVSLFDSLNYILDYNDLKKVFSNVSNLLSEDGIFIFDMNTIDRLMSIEPGTMILNGENYSCFWEDVVEKEKKLWKVKLKIYFGENEKEFFTETHCETAYPIKDIIAALKWAGFSEIETFKAYTFEQGNDSDNRVYFAASKNLLSKNNGFINKMSKKVKWKLIKNFFF